ncbi:uncharacterized protein [Diadema antillarum]|uniref:uncharacterized protein n=1 Tax=Diadema antillarum TaxID=105358 RepID=UPI003A89B9EF
MNSLLCALVLVACIAPIYGFNCHSCAYVSGVGGDECTDPFASSGVSNVSCSSNCAKVVVKVDNSVTTLTRSCSSICSNGCISLFGISTCTYCCTSELCNSATSVGFSVTALVATVLAALGLSV